MNDVKPIPQEVSGPGPRDVGTTLIEILVSVLILGIAGVAVLTALAAAARGAAVQREVSDAQAWLATTGDAIAAVDSVDDTYIACATPAQYQPVVDAVLVPDAPIVVVSDISFWDGSGFGRTCQYAAGNRLQEVTVQTTIDGVTRSITVVKRPALEPTIAVGPPAPGGGGGTGSVVPRPTPGLDG